MKNTSNREPFYILIILVLLIIMFVQYTKYKEDSFSRITQCFADVVPEAEQDFCESFYEKYRDPLWNLFLFTNNSKYSLNLSIFFYLNNISNKS